MYNRIHGQLKDGFDKYRVEPDDGIWDDMDPDDLWIDLEDLWATPIGDL